MKVTILLENNACRDDVKCAHGLSMHVATEKHSLLFDMGPNALFLENAETLGVDIAGVDVAFLSHAHDDHSGGLELFCRRNHRAPVFMQREAWGRYYVVTPDKCKYLGLDKALRRYDSRFHYVESSLTIDSELQLFQGGLGRDYRSHANDTLREKHGEEYLPDEFRHEQSLIVTEGGKAVLLGGCAHNGIVNILRRSEELLGRAPDAVFAGFHLYNPSLGISEPRELVDSIAQELRARKNTVFYTGHCTGQEAFGVMKETLGEQLIPMRAGDAFTI
ncbi:MAG: MBL fold metallo-hydrolase [Oscillospiraceae bacterium]|nr:MBL fold metallo-hydrolase [Oscillospiraceae bacterium]